MRKPIEKFLNTIDILASATDNIGRIVKENTNEVRIGYKQKDLGLKKWASIICSIISNKIGESKNNNNKQKIESGFNSER